MQCPRASHRRRARRAERTETHAWAMSAHSGTRSARERTPAARAPRSSFGTHTDRHTVVTLLSTPTPPVEFWDTHRQTVTLLTVQSFGTHTDRHTVVTLLSTPTPPVEFWDTHRQTVTLLTVHTDTPGRVLGHRQTDRQTVYMGEELGNYVHQNSNT